MIEQHLLNALKKAQADYALDALKRPNDRTEFEYGKHVGYVQGIEKSIETLLNLLNEEKHGK